MTTRTRQRGQHNVPYLRAVSAWVGLLLILFNVFSAATMGFGPMPGIPDAEMSMCAAMGHGSTADHDHPTKHPSSGCACCLSMCCTGAAVPDDRLDAPVPSSSWTALSFDFTLSAQRRPAPSVGGIARAPPQVV